MATAPRGKGQRLALELGDIIFELDEGVSVKPSRWSRDTILVYSARLDAFRAYTRIAHWPPAYASRVTPAMVILDSNLEGLRRLLRYARGGLGITEVNVEVHERGGDVSNAIYRVLREEGFRLRRASRYWLVVEHLEGEATIAALLGARCDRVDRLWDPVERRRCLEEVSKLQRVLRS